MEGPAAPLQLLGSQDRTHLPVDVEEPDPIGGQLQQSFKLLLQVAHRLLQTETDGLHSLTPANVHHGTAGAQVHLGQRGQVTVLGYEDVVPARKQGSGRVFAFCFCNNYRITNRLNTVTSNYPLNSSSLHI